MTLISGMIQIVSVFSVLTYSSNTVCKSDFKKKKKIITLVFMSLCDYTKHTKPPLFGDVTTVMGHQGRRCKIHYIVLNPLERSAPRQL